MAPELEKLRSLPTPRWTLAVVVGLVALAFVAMLFAGSDQRSDYVDAAEGMAGLGSVIGSIVIGVWVAGVEYGQNTIRRALAADPRRERLLTAKLTLAIGSALALTLAAWVTAVVLLPVAASLKGAPSPTGDIVSSAAGSLVVNPIYAAIGCAIATLTRSMAGGMTVMLALVFVLDSIISALPIGDISLGSALNDISNAIEGEKGDHEVGRGLLVAAAWVVALLGSAWARFTRTDVT